MKKALIAAIGLAFLAGPVLAQQSPTGQSSGGPARVGNPGETGVPSGGPAPKTVKKVKKAKKKMQ